MPDHDRADLRPARESSPWVAILIVIVLLAGGAYWWYRSQQMPKTEAPPEVATAPVPDTAPAAPPPAPEPVGPQFPVEPTADATLPKLDDADGAVRSALNDLLGSKGVTSFLQIDGFVRRFVATVDNLPREQAASRVWPVVPATSNASSRLAVSGAGEIKTIDADNGARYTPFVLFAESIDPAKAAAVYIKLYPLFQQAYEELGYPGRYFNDRLVAVIDHLLATPEPAGPVQVKLTEVKGDVSSQRPWVRYEFVDPQLQSMSAGQKIMVRIGLVNERRLKAKLTELRRAVASGAVAAKK